MREYLIILDECRMKSVVVKANNKKDASEKALNKAVEKSDGGSDFKIYDIQLN